MSLNADQMIKDAMVNDVASSVIDTSAFDLVKKVRDNETTKYKLNGMGHVVAMIPYTYKFIDHPLPGGGVRREITDMDTSFWHMITQHNKDLLCGDPDIENKAWLKLLRENEKVANLISVDKSFGRARKTAGNIIIK